MGATEEGRSTMESIEVKLPDRVVQILKQRSGKSGSSLEELITDILVDHAFSSTESSRAGRVADGAEPSRNEVSQPPESILGIGERRGGSWQTGEPLREQGNFSFAVATEFPRLDRLTIQQTQKFVDAALDYRGVRAFKNEDGIGFDPNFVFIERVYTKEVGFSASFYGAPSTFADYEISMLPGPWQQLQSAEGQEPRGSGSGPESTPHLCSS